jgi:hypothetical protein
VIVPNVVIDVWPTYDDEISTVGLPETPSPFVIVILPPVPVIVLTAHVLDPVLAAMPLDDRPSNAAKSSARAKVSVPDVVIGDPEIVSPDAGCDAETDVTVPPPPIGTPFIVGVALKSTTPVVLGISSTTFDVEPSSEKRVITNLDPAFPPDSLELSRLMSHLLVPEVCIFILRYVPALPVTVNPLFVSVLVDVIAPVDLLIVRNEFPPKVPLSLY